jgi:hypothetical protein
LGYDGLSLISKDSSGSLEYPEEVREELYTRMGKTQPYKEVKRILAKPRYQQYIKDIIAQRRLGKTSQEVSVKNSPLFQELNAVVLQSKETAEQSLREDSGWIGQYIDYSKQAKRQAELGNPTGESQLRQQAEELLKEQNY